MACSADKETYHPITKEQLLYSCSFVCFFKNIKSQPRLQRWDLFCLLPLHNASGVYATVQQLFGALESPSQALYTIIWLKTVIISDLITMPFVWDGY
jgi:hypothetical protein